MAQISLYVDEATITRLNEVARINNCSISRYVGTLIEHHFSEVDEEEQRKKKLLNQLWGALKDPTFIEPPEIPWSYEIPRKLNLL